MNKNIIKKYHYVYKTTNLLAGKSYVGDHSTNNLDDGYLGSGKYLQRAIKKHGLKNFSKKILVFFTTREEAFNARAKYIEMLNTLVPNGYNISLKGGHQCPKSFSEETKRQISKKCSESLKGRKLSESHKKNLVKAAKNRKLSTETKNKIRKTKLGGKSTEETKQKISKALRGRKFTDEHKEKLRKVNLGELNPMYGKDSWNKGKTGIYSEEALRKLSKASKGNNHLLGYKHTDEAKKKMSEASKGNKRSLGYKHTDEAKKKMSESHKNKKPWNKGKKLSEETRQKLSNSHKGKNVFKNIPVGKCKYCGIEMKMSHLNRYHNDNCKRKDGQTQVG